MGNRSLSTAQFVRTSFLPSTVRMYVLLAAFYNKQGKSELFIDLEAGFPGDNLKNQSNLWKRSVHSGIYYEMEKVAMSQVNRLPHLNWNVYSL